MLTHVQLVGFIVFSIFPFYLSHCTPVIVEVLICKVGFNIKLIFPLISLNTSITIYEKQLLMNIPKYPTCPISWFYYLFHFPFLPFPLYPRHC